MSIKSDKFSITVPTKTALLGFLAECKKAPAAGVPAVAGASPALVAAQTVPATILDNPALQKLADGAKSAADLKIKELHPDHSHISNWRALWKIVPGTEPTIDPTADDIKDILNQSRQWNNQLVDALVKEYGNNSSKLPVNWFSRLPGWFPTLKTNHDFEVDAFEGQYGVA